MSDIYRAVRELPVEAAARRRAREKREEEAGVTEPKWDDLTDATPEWLRHVIEDSDDDRTKDAYREGWNAGYAAGCAELRAALAAKDRDLLRVLGRGKR